MVTFWFEFGIAGVPPPFGIHAIWSPPPPPSGGAFSSSPTAVLEGEIEETRIPGSAIGESHIPFSFCVTVAAPSATPRFPGSSSQPALRSGRIRGGSRENGNGRQRPAPPGENKVFHVNQNTNTKKTTDGNENTDDRRGNEPNRMKNETPLMLDHMVTWIRFSGTEE